MVKWVSIPEYGRQTGLSRASINKLIEEKQIVAIETEGGGQIRIQTEDNRELEEIKSELLYTRNTLKRLCSHFGIQS